MYFVFLVALFVTLGQIFEQRILKSNPSSYSKDVVNNFTTFTTKHQEQNPFLEKLEAFQDLQLYQEKPPSQVNLGKFFKTLIL